MQEAPNSYEKDEQQERGNYDSANYMETKWTHKTDKKCRYWGLFKSASFHQ